jgi:hypothetical protein
MCRPKRSRSTSPPTARHEESSTLRCHPDNRRDLAPNHNGSIRSPTLRCIACLRTGLAHGSGLLIQEPCRLPSHDISRPRPPSCVILTKEESRSPCLPKEPVTFPPHNSRCRLDRSGETSFPTAKIQCVPRCCSCMLHCPVVGEVEIPPVVGMTSELGGHLGAGWSGTGFLHSGRNDTREGRWRGNEVTTRRSRTRFFLRQNDRGGWTAPLAGVAGGAVHPHPLGKITQSRNCVFLPKSG